MKKKLPFITLLVSFLLHYSNVESQILTNAGFETWATGSSGYPDPANWTTNNSAGNQKVKQAAGRTGTYSVNLVSVSDGSGGYRGGRINFYYSGSQKPTALTGYWKGNFLSSGDEMKLYIEVENPIFSLIGSGTLFTPHSTNITAWTAFNCPINYTTSDPVAAVTVEFDLWYTTSLNTSVFLDDLAMTFATGIETQTVYLLGASLNHDFQSGNYFLTVDFLFPSSFDVEIFDVMGKKVYTRNYSFPNGHYEIPFSTSQFREGVYQCRIKGKNMDRTFKFVL